MKQQSKGQGTITYDAKHNSYRAYYTTPKGNRPSKRFKTKKEAAEWLAAQQSAVAANNFTEPSKITLGAWLLMWLEKYKKDAVSIRTMERYTEFAAKVEPIAATPLQQVTPLQMQDLYQKIGEKLSACTVSKIHKMLKASMKKAVEIGLLPKNVMDAVVPPKFEKPEIVTFTKEEICALLASAQKYAGGKYYPMVLLAITSGMRLGEILALRFCDVSTKRNEVSITRNLQMTKQGIVIRPPKTKAGRRIITLPPEVITRLYNLHSERKVLALEDFIFITKNGTPYEPRNIERAWKTIAERSGVIYRNFHVLRHTHCTDLLAAGVPIVEVARRVGHARISHTLELYGHAIPRYDQEIANKVGGLYLVK